MTPLPHEIRGPNGEVYYRCRPCRKETDLHWFRGTSCPVCSSPECHAKLEAEWQSALADNETE